jgi:hypothetical protein
MARAAAEKFHETPMLKGAFIRLDGGQCFAPRLEREKLEQLGSRRESGAELAPW